MSQFPDTKRAGDYGVGNRDFFKFEKGDNRLRILALAQEPLATHFLLGKERVTCIGVSRGCKYHGENAPKDEKGNEKRPSVKYPAYVIDRKTEDIRLVYLPFSIVTALRDLKSNVDWAFEELPMPYDITVAFDPDAAGKDMYKVIPSPKQVAVTAEILEKLSKLKAIDEIADSAREKAASEAGVSLDTTDEEIQIQGESDSEPTPF